MKKIMKKVLSLALVIALAIAPMTAMAADGTYADPHQLSATSVRFYVYVEPGETQYVQVDDCNGTTVEVGYATSGTYQLIYGRQTVFPNQDVDNTASLSMQIYSDIFGVYNAGDEAVSVYMSLTAGQTEGTMDNPKQVTLEDQYGMGFLSAYEYTPLEAGNEGYYYTVTADEDGAILVSVNASDDDGNDVGWFYYVNNMTKGQYGDFHWSDDDEPVYTETCPVSAGDEVLVFAATYDPNNMWSNPAGNVGVSFGFAAIGSSEYPVEITGNGSYTAPITANSQGYNYRYTATENGTLTITMSDTNSNGWQYQVNNLTTYAYGDLYTNVDNPVSSSYSVAVSVGDEVTIMVATYDAENPYAAPPEGTVEWTLSFEAGAGNPGGSGNEGGSGSEGEEEEEEANYVEDSTPLVVGDNALTVSNMYQYTVYYFQPTETGKYTFTTNDSVMGIVGYYWVSGNPTAEVVKETSFEWNCTDVNQGIYVAVMADTNVANINIAKGDLDASDEIPWTVYTNKKAPTAFAFSGDANKLEYVNTEDAVVDKAVLGKDGYYHLNKEDGEILYVNLNDSIMSIISMAGYGKVSAVEYDADDNVVAKYDYTNAVLEYAECVDANTSLYPLTEDLITIYQEVGKANTWYGENGWIGGTAEDAWMFACYYVKGQTTSTTPAPEQNSGVAGGSTTAKPSSPSTGDNANVAVWAIAMVVAAGAAYVVAESKKRAR